jgi:putative acetyltransferase
MRTRPETPEDCSAIESVHIAAFKDHPYSRQTEHLIVNALRAEHALDVSLVAEVGGKVVGHIAFSKIKINGQDCTWFMLGPIGVLPDHQRKGIGGELVRQGLEEIKRLCAEGCVLVGDPAYYTRFGFTEARGLVFEGVPAKNCLYLPMSQRIPRGSVSHHPAFSVVA